MPFLKERQVAHGAISLWTGDFDTNAGSPTTVFDEIGSTNPLIIHGDKFYFGEPNINEVEPSFGKGMVIARDGPIEQAAWGDIGYPTHFEGLHNTIYNFDDINREFSVEVFANFDTFNPGLDALNTFTRFPLIEKLGLFKMQGFYNYASGIPNLVVNTIGLNTTIFNGNPNYDKVMDQPFHVVLTYSVQPLTATTWTRTIRVFFEGRIVNELVDVLNNSQLPDLNNTSNIFIGKDPTIVSPSNPGPDFLVNRMSVENIAIYDRALTESEVTDHFTRFKRMNTYLEQSRPNYKFDFADDHTGTLDDDILNSGISGNVDARYIGSIGYNNGVVNQVFDSTSVHLPIDGYLQIRNSAATNRSFLTSNNLSIAMRFRTTDSARANIIHARSNYEPYDGISVKINSKNGAYQQGVIEFSPQVGVFINTPDNMNFNDGAWHSIGVRRDNTTWSFYIDGLLIGETPSIAWTNYEDASFRVFNSDDGLRPLIGDVSTLLYYTRAVRDNFFALFQNHASKWSIQGRILLNGNPIPAEFRYYYSISGELEGHGVADVDGEYAILVPDNSPRDIVILPFNGDQTIGYFIHGQRIPIPIT